MKKSKRILLLLCFIEAIFIGGSLLLLYLTKDLQPAPGYESGETAVRIMEMMGLFGGAIGGVLLVLYFVVRSRERDGA
jgi:cytosine/uracil/thiamine/allantoin permease